MNRPDKRGKFRWKANWLAFHLNGRTLFSGFRSFCCFCRVRSSQDNQLAWSSVELAVVVVVVALCCRLLVWQVVD